MLRSVCAVADAQPSLRFNGHPPLRVNATVFSRIMFGSGVASFNGHPPLRVNATCPGVREAIAEALGFQRAPTLEGECYRALLRVPASARARFNGHPPLRVNATV